MTFPKVVEKYKDKTARAVTIAAALGFIIYLFPSNTLDIKFIQDDAYTSFRYAENFVNGNGLVFNQEEKVEGYTNFLWVLLLSGQKVIRDLIFPGSSVYDPSGRSSGMENAAQFLSLFFSVLTLILTYFISLKINRRDDNSCGLSVKAIYELANLVPVFLVSVSTPLIYWGVSGMETTLFVSLTLLSLTLAMRDDKKGKPDYLFVSVSFLNSLVRPEGAIIFLIIESHKIFYNYLQDKRSGFSLKTKPVPGLPYLKELLCYTIPLALYLCFRIIYYGYPLPNTFYAKTEFSSEFIVRGLNYFLQFSENSLLYGSVLILPLILFLKKEKTRDISLLFYFVIAWIMSVIIIGGDVLPVHRFFLPVIPVIAVLFTRSVALLAELFIPGKRGYLFVSAAAFIALICAGVMNYDVQKTIMMEKRGFETGLVKKMKIYADWINDKNKGGRKFTVAMSTIGAFSYFTNSRVIDIVGLTDGYISHHPKKVEGIGNELPVIWKERNYNADYVLSVKPDYIIFPAGAKPSAFAECALFVNEEFNKNYYAQIFYSAELNQMLPIFTRKENVRGETDCKPCSIRYLKYYIEAENNLLTMIAGRDMSLLNKIIEGCDKVIGLCPGKFSEAGGLKGMAYFHSGNFSSAENILLSAVKSDESNSAAGYYLMRTYLRLGRDREAYGLIPLIKRYSPGVFPGLAAD